MRLSGTGWGKRKGESGLEYGSGEKDAQAGRCRRRNKRRDRRRHPGAGAADRRRTLRGKDADGNHARRSHLHCGLRRRHRLRATHHRAMAAHVQAAGHRRRVGSRRGAAGRGQHGLRAGRQGGRRACAAHADKGNGRRRQEHLRQQQKGAEQPGCLMGTSWPHHSIIPRRPSKRSLPSRYGRGASPSAKEGGSADAKQQRLVVRLSLSFPLLASVQGEGRKREENPRDLESGAEAVANTTPASCRIDRAGGGCGVNAGEAG